MPPAKSVQVRRGPGRPARISVAQIVDAALTVGLEDLTLRKVADLLRVSPAALYNYVTNVEELVALVGDALADQGPLPDLDGRPWEDWAYDAAWQLRRMLESAPGLAEHAMRYGAQSPGLLRLVDRAVQVAVDAGFDPVRAMWVTRAVADYVEGFVARQQSRARTAAAVGHSPEQAVRAAVKGDPELALTRRYLRSVGRQPLERQFEFTLRMLITAAAASRDAPI